MIVMNAWTTKIFEVEIEDVEDRKKGEESFL
jgi:hypothetical protein